jgi:uncharacterized RDD family membrane protein YckC
MLPPSAERTLPAIPAGVALASLRRRSLGALLDLVIVSLPAAFLTIVLALPAMAKRDAMNEDTFRIASGAEFTANQRLAVVITTIATAVLYAGVMTALWGRTVGKLANGTKVIRLNDGRRPDWTYSFIRALVPAVAQAIPAVGLLAVIGVYLVALIDPLRQGLHDKAAGTVVVMAG